MEKALWPKMKKSLPTNVQREFRGVNRLDPFTINPNFASDVSNITTDSYPAMTVRTGYELTGAALAARVLGLGVWKDTQLHAVSNGNWYYLSAGVWTSAASGLSMSANWSFTNFQGNFADFNLIGANGTDPIKRWDGATLTNLSDAPSGGNYMETYGERAWCAVGNELHGSALGNATNWTTFNQDDADPYIRDIETPNGELINAIKAGNNHLTIFKPNSIHELFGYTPSDFRTLPVTLNVGVVSNQAIASVEGVFYFIHRTGLYKYSGGVLPSKQFSEAVQNYIDRINPVAAAKCCAGSNGRFVYFGLPIDSATEPNVIIEYNTEFGTFSVWEDYSPLNMAEMAGTVYIGNVNGQVREVGASSSDNGTPIAWRWVTKPLGAESLSQRIRWKRAWVVADIPSGSTFNAYMSKEQSGDSDWVLVQTVPATTVINSTRLIIPTNAAFNAKWIRLKFEGTGPCSVYEWSREEDQLPIY